MLWLYQLILNGIESAQVEKYVKKIKDWMLILNGIESFIITSLTFAAYKVVNPQWNWKSGVINITRLIRFMVNPQWNWKETKVVITKPADIEVIS